MTGEAYEGYANRETFKVDLVLNNEYEVYHRFMKVARDHLVDCETEETEPNARDLGLEIKDAFEYWLEELEETNVKEYISKLREFGSLWRVDWDEIGQSWLDSAKEYGD